jgi:hypothetical protein
MTPEERERRIREIAERLAERLDTEWREGDLTVNDIEELAERVGQEVQREITERFLREEAVRKEGPHTACPCGATATYRGRNALTVVTTGGRVRVERAYYYCGSCRQGHCPADARLGLGPANTTPAAQARLAVLAALATYVQVPDLIAQLGLPLRVDIKSLERVAQRVGAQLAVARPQPFGLAQRTLAVGFDGVMYPTYTGNQEARVAVVYEPDWEAGRTPAAEVGLRKEYFATTGSRKSLVAAACARARARAGGVPVVVVSDGQALDWVDLEPLLPERIEILDFYHVRGRLAEIAVAMHGEAGTAATAWSTEMQQELLDWGPRKLLEALRDWQPADEKAREVRRLQRAYFERQEERLRYPDFLRRGYPIGSGAVEGTCKHVIADRFDGSGMRWKPGTADPLMHLRAALLSQPRLDLRPYAAAGAQSGKVAAMVA